MPHNAVGSIKAGYQQSPTANKTSHYHLFSLEAGSLFWVSQTFLSSSILTGHEWQENQRGVDENYNKTALFLMLRMLEMTFLSFSISNFFRGEHFLRPSRGKEFSWPFHWAQTHKTASAAAWGKSYQNPWECYYITLDSLPLHPPSNSSPLRQGFHKITTWHQLLNFFLITFSVKP